MTELNLSEVKEKLRKLASTYPDRFRRSRRIFIEERCAALSNDREAEYEVKEKVSSEFGIKYSEVAFTGSAQIGFSPHKDREFIRAESDLDVACISPELFQKAWINVLETTRAFSDETKFPAMTPEQIDYFKQCILKRGMIRIETMPLSGLSQSWKDAETRITRNFSKIFGKVSVAIYMNEYAFCWKQDSAISSILRTHK